VALADGPTLARAKMPPRVLSPGIVATSRVVDGARRNKRSQALRGVVAVLSGLFMLASPFVGTTFVLITILLVFDWWLPAVYNWVGLGLQTYWYWQIVSFIEVFNGVQLVVTGDDIPTGARSESALVICNHPSESDWMWFWSVALRAGAQGGVRIVLKHVLMYVPVLGWCMDWFGYIFLCRDWKIDEHQITHSIAQMKKDRAKFNRDFWLFLFPEGTDYSKRKHEKSRKYARQHNLPEYENLLLPRTTGFVHFTHNCGDVIDAVYDMTIAYESADVPTFWSAATGVSPRIVHMHIRRYPRAVLPKHDDHKRWAQVLFDMYAEKDKLLARFAREQRFDTKPAAWWWPIQTWRCALAIAFWFMYNVVQYYFFYQYVYLRYYAYAGMTLQALSVFYPFRQIFRLSPWPKQQQQQQQQQQQSRAPQSAYASPLAAAPASSPAAGAHGLTQRHTAAMAASAE